jgi:hypothetical protein
MKSFPLNLLGWVLVSFIFFTSCVDNCKNAQNGEVGGEFFTVEYVNGDGVNYIEEIYNPSGIVVFLDTTGGEDRIPDYELITPGFEDGKFGPFFFTERYTDAATEQINNILLFNKRFKFDYYFKKDTYGQDTLSVEFLLGVDECGYEWSSINYFHNGVLLDDYINQRNAAIVIEE